MNLAWFVPLEMPPTVIGVLLGYSLDRNRLGSTGVDWFYSIYQGHLFSTRSLMLIAIGKPHGGWSKFCICMGWMRPHNYWNKSPTQWCEADFVPSTLGTSIR